MEAFAIFEGGGAKGLAHVGALQACEERGVQFRGVAGASAGALVAALIAAGYKSSELFDLNDPADALRPYSRNFLEFFGPGWRAFEDFREDARSLLSHPLRLWAWIELPGFWFRNWRIIRAAKTRFGIFQTTLFESELEKLLAAKLKVGADQKVKFTDIPVTCPLKIVATDVQNRRLVVFSRETTPLHSVAKAVAASVSLPFVFQPHSLELGGGAGVPYLATAVDGGLLSNFPAWLFDAERKSRRNLPTLGFRLVTAPPNEHVGTFGKYLGALIDTVTTGDPILETRQITNLHEVRLKVSASTLDFRMSPQKKVRLFGEGLLAAREFFERPQAPRDPKKIAEGLQAVLEAFREELDLTPVQILRATIAMPTSEGELRVIYHCGLEPGDVDDYLTFPIQTKETLGAMAARDKTSGACGLAWETEKSLKCDLLEAKTNHETNWGMSRYQQALVRKTLRSLLCIPIPNPKWTAGIHPDERLLGVLNFDSDSDILSKFSEPVIVEIAESLAAQVSELLTQ